MRKKHKEFFRELKALCDKHGVSYLNTGSRSPGFVNFLKGRGEYSIRYCGYTEKEKTLNELEVQQEGPWKEIE